MSLAPASSLDSSLDDSLFDFYSQKKEREDLASEVVLVRSYLKNRNHPERLFVDPNNPTRRITLINLAARVGSVDALKLLSESSPHHFRISDRTFLSQTFERLSRFGSLALKLDSIATCGQTDPPIFDAAQSLNMENFAYLLDVESQLNPKIPPHRMLPTAQPLLSYLILSELTPTLSPELKESRHYLKKIEMTLKRFGADALDAKDCEGKSARDLLASFNQPLLEICRPWIETVK